MLKVLIVEDEFLARVGLRSFIDWNNNGFELLEDAVDGEQALATIYRELPDIILLDIQIPKVNGVEVLRRMREREIHSKVIVISCNDDFEPVKQAMGYGAVDYLRKFTLNADDLLRILLQIRDSLLNALPESEQGSAGDDKYFEQQYMNIVAGDSAQLPENAPLHRGHTLFLDVDDPDEHFYTINNASFLNIIRQTMRSYGVEAVAFQSGSNTFCVLFCCGFAPLSIAGKVQEQLMRTISVSVSIGVGPAWEGGDALRQSLAAAKKISYEKFYRGSALLRAYEREAPPMREQADTESLTRAGAALLEARDYAAVTVLAAQTLECAIQSGELYPDSLKVASLEVLGRLSAMLGLPYKEGRMQDFKAVMDAQNAEALRVYILARVENLLGQVGDEGKGGCSKIVADAVGYIHGQMGEAITLAKLARAVNVSESYLSMLFKKEMGENCITYINRVKMEAAQKMLLEDLLVYEIAERLGYENSNYFGKVFKKYTGLTPEKYRAQGGQGA